MCFIREERVPKRIKRLNVWFYLIEGGPSDPAVGDPSSIPAARALHAGPRLGPQDLRQVPRVRCPLLRRQTG